VGIPIKTALNMAPKITMTEITLTSKDTETQHLNFLDAVIESF